MTLEETKQLLTILKLSYPNNYKDMSKDQAINTVKLYYDFFGEHPTPLVVQALKNYIKSNKYPPTIAGLQEQVDLLINHGNTSEELWSKMVKAIRNSLYGSVEEFEKLPKECQMWLGSPSGLKDLGMIDVDTLNTVLHGQFLKTIGDIKAGEKAQQGLSQGLRDMLQNKTRLLE